MRFILVDEILELEPLKRIVATKRVSGNEDYFPDHFPGYPVVPGVLLVEMIAQAAGKCLLAGIDKSLWPVFLQIRQANFRRSVLPDSSLVIEALVETCNERTSAINGKVLCNGKVMAEASILLGFISRSFLKADYQDKVLQDYFSSHPQYH
jgi:3-hydroxyacyl-[acyl-carrier-protein] dehydratase